MGHDFGNGSDKLMPVQAHNLQFYSIFLTHFVRMPKNTFEDDHGHVTYTLPFSH